MMTNYDRLTEQAKCQHLVSSEKCKSMPSNGFMDNMKVDLIKEKQQLGEPLTKKQKEFLDNPKKLRRNT